MKIAIACDHRGVDVKQELTKYLQDKGYNVINCGTDSTDMVDYPDYAFEVGKKVVKKEADYGILICNTGIGMSIAANKVKGVRCARVQDEYDAKMTRTDNDANVIALSARTDIEKLKRILDVFLNTEFANIDRYKNRIEKIDNYES